MTLTLNPSQAVAFDAVGAALFIGVVRTESARTVVALRGEADASTTTAVSDVLAQVVASHPGDVVVDLSGLEFIDSATVRIFASTKDVLASRGRRLVVRSPSRLALVVLDVFGLSDLVATAPRDGPQAA